MIYFLTIHKDDDVWKITDTLIESQINEYDPEKQYQCSKEIYEYVGNLLKMKKTLTVPGDKLGFMGAHITRYDINIEDNFSNYHYIENERKAMSDNWDMYNTIQLFKLLFANNRLIEKGYILTPENQEKIVNQMIDKDDKEALSLYEDFYKSNLFFEELNRNYEKIKELESILSDAKTEEEAQEKYTEWKSNQTSK